MKRRRIDEEGEGVDKSGGLAPDADSDRDVGTAWLLDDPNLLELILDHCLPIQPSNEVDHPLRAVNRATRRAWRAHPISLPFHVYNTLSEATPKPASQLPLDHRLKLVEMLEHAMANFKSEAEEEHQQRQANIATEQNRLQLLARVDAWVAEMRDKELMKRDGGTLSPDEERELLRLGEEARAIVSRATDIVMNCLHHYNGDTYCWRKETVSFVIGDAEFLQTFNQEVDGACEDDELEIPEELEELREQWGTTLDPQTLHKLFRFLLTRQVSQHEYTFAETYD